MQRKNIIVIVSPEVEVWGNFKKMCDVKHLPYHSLKMLKFPILFKDYVIYKVEFKQIENRIIAWGILPNRYYKLIFMKWIDIKLEKPKTGKSVLVYCVPKFSFDDEIEDFEILIGYRECDDWYLNSKDLDEIKFISHWMELPKKPKL